MAANFDIVGNKFRVLPEIQAGKNAPNNELAIKFANIYSQIEKPEVKDIFLGILSGKEVVGNERDIKEAREWVKKYLVEFSNVEDKQIEFRGKISTISEISNDNVPKVYNTHKTQNTNQVNQVSRTAKEIGKTAFEIAKWPLVAIGSIGALYICKKLGVPNLLFSAGKNLDKRPNGVNGKLLIGPLMPQKHNLSLEKLNELHKEISGRWYNVGPFKKKSQMRDKVTELIKTKEEEVKAEKKAQKAKDKSRNKTKEFVAINRELMLNTLAQLGVNSPLLSCASLLLTFFSFDKTKKMIAKKNAFAFASTALSGLSFGVSLLRPALGTLTGVASKICSSISNSIPEVSLSAPVINQAPAFEPQILYQAPAHVPTQVVAASKLAKDQSVVNQEAVDISESNVSEQPTSAPAA